MELLVVEDDPIARELLELVLSSRGHSVRAATDGTAALRSARERRPDGVITDLRLPGDVDGRELVRRLREDPVLAGVVVVVLTGQVDAAGVVAVTGADVALAKPFDIPELVEVVERLGARG
ncbi:response regulator transcription factor [Nakamurella alba]|uniref:response regulator transcription factor n=1 Tax=Nakamurella alba TaxID=2665158 RepID=UPI0012BA237A|nr:response regulator [Nakamurella alba]